MVNEVTSIHWHGCTMAGTNWADGVGGLTHCYIQPRQTFSYRFRPHPSGTHWYHANAGTQRSMGLFGPLIVLPDPALSKYAYEEDMFDGEFIMMVNDWYMDDSLDYALPFLKGGVQSQKLLQPNKCQHRDVQEDGVYTSLSEYQSGLINGKGWITDKNTGQPVNKHTPLEIFKVAKGGKYRFRVIVASMGHAFRISVDSHKLTIISLDGTDVVEREADSFVLNVGERLDFYIDATDPDDTGNYWVRAETLGFTGPDKQEDAENPGDHRYAVYAILRYDSTAAAAGLPQTQESCLTGEVCQVINCPFEEYHKEENKHCVPITDLQSAVSSDIPEERDVFIERFLNFHVIVPTESYPNTGSKATINGITNKPLSTPALLYPTTYQDNAVDCNMTQLTLEGTTTCSHILEVPLGAVVQLNLLSTLYVPDSADDVNIPIHIHGHKFEVLKIGYPVYDENTGYISDTNKDIECADPPLCHEARWADDSWDGGHVPGAPSSPPVKDTVQIPTGGYVVIQFEANNPGFWLLSSVLETYLISGMSLILKVGDTEDFSQLPQQLPKCGDFDPDISIETVDEEPDDQEQESIANVEKIILISDDSDVYLVPFVILVCVCVFLIAAIILVLKKTKTKGSYERIAGFDIDSDSDKHSDEIDLKKYERI